MISQRITPARTQRPLVPRPWVVRAAIRVEEFWAPPSNAATEDEQGEGKEDGSASAEDVGGLCGEGLGGGGNEEKGVDYPLLVGRYW